MGKLSWYTKWKALWRYFYRVSTCIGHSQPMKSWLRPPVFLGSFLPSLTFVMNTLASGSKGTLVVNSVSNIGPHYARTLREWRRRFVERFETVVVPALQKEHELRWSSGKVKNELGRYDIEVFKRKWICNFVSCFRIVGHLLADGFVFRLLLLLWSWIYDEITWWYDHLQLGLITRFSADSLLVDHVVTFMREGNQDYGCDV